MLRGLPAALTGAFLLSVTMTAAAEETPLERGTYLMRGPVACGNCHTPQGPDGPLPGMELAGGMPIEEPGLFVAMVPNITPDPETGIGNWTDEQIITAIREGKRPDGTIIGPPMPIEFYRDLSDTDVKAIVAYLRSVKPVRNEVAKSTYNIPLPPAYGPPVESVPDVPKTDRLAYGAYIAGPLAHCLDCHTPLGPDMRRDMAKLGAGGFPIHGPWGESISANLTPDKATGLGEWTDEEIKTAITKGIRKDGTALAPPMGYAYYANISAEDLDALIAYLRSLKPVENAVK
ncbi:MAG: cytochrome c [Alphaproteobacteria bacterium]